MSRKHFLILMLLPCFMVLYLASDQPPSTWQNIWIQGRNADEEGIVGGMQVSPKKQPGFPFFKGQGWAVVIGISKYKHSAGAFSELRYAAKSAEAFYNFLRSPKGGGFAPDHILFLQDEEATLENIKDAFSDFLGQAPDEDFIVVSLYGHGTLDVNNPDNLYLTAYDSRPDRIVSTAFPMRDINTALSRHIKSEKVIMFADACHSAEIGCKIALRKVLTGKSEG